MSHRGGPSTWKPLVLLAIVLSPILLGLFIMRLLSANVSGESSVMPTVAFGVLVIALGYAWWTSNTARGG